MQRCSFLYIIIKSKIFSSQTIKENDLRRKTRQDWCCKQRIRAFEWLPAYFIPLFCCKSHISWIDVIRIFWHLFLSLYTSVVSKRSVLWLGIIHSILYNIKNIFISTDCVSTMMWCVTLLSVVSMVPIFVAGDSKL